VIDDPFRIGNDPFTPEEAVSILCRVVSRWCDEIGNEGDAVACRLAEHVLVSLIRSRKPGLPRALTPLKPPAPESEAQP